MPGQIRELNYLTERQVQRLWFDKIGKFLGFPESGSTSLWPTNAERFGGQGTFIYRLFSGDAQFQTKTWLGFGEGLPSSEAIPLMTRTVADTKDKVVFFAGLYGAKEAVRSYNRAGGNFVNRNVKLEDLVEAYKLLNPDIKPDPVPEDQTRLEDFDEEVSWAKDEIEGFKKPITDEGEIVISDQEKRMELIQLILDLTPDNLFNDTQTDMLGTYGNNWIFAVMSKPTDEYGNVYYNRYVSDGFVPFMEYADDLIKFLDRQITLGNPEFTKINEYFKKIKEEGQFKNAKSDAIWMVRPPNNNRQMLEMFGAYEQLPLQKTFFGAIKKSDVNWQNILKAEMAPADGSPPDDEDEKEDEYDYAKPEKEELEDGLKRIKPYARERGDTFIVDGKEETEGEWKNSPLGQQEVVTMNWEDSCCQKLKEDLIKLYTVELDNRKKNIHEDRIRQTISNMSCAELSEYMEPPTVAPNNFTNLRFFGILAGDLDGALREAFDVQGMDVQRYLYEQYTKCLEYHLSSVIKPPSESTDPVKDKIDVPSGDILVELETSPHREFEGFSFDTGTSDKGELTEDEKTEYERMREQIIHGKRKDTKDDTFQEEEMAQPMQEEWWRQQQHDRMMPSKDKFLNVWNATVKGMRNTPSTVSNVKRAIEWPDANVRDRFGFSEREWEYLYNNFEKIHQKYML